MRLSNSGTNARNTLTFAYTFIKCITSSSYMPIGLGKKGIKDGLPDVNHHIVDNPVQEKLLST